MDVFIAKALAYFVIQAIVFIIVLTGLAMFGFHVAAAAPRGICRRTGAHW